MIVEITPIRPIETMLDQALERARTSIILLTLTGQPARTHIMYMIQTLAAPPTTTTPSRLETTTPIVLNG